MTMVCSVCNRLHLSLELLRQHLAVLSQGVQGSGHLYPFAVDLASLDGRDACLGPCSRQMLSNAADWDIVQPCQRAACMFSKRLSCHDLCLPLTVSTPVLVSKSQPDTTTACDLRLASLLCALLRAPR